MTSRRTMWIAVLLFLAVAPLRVDAQDVAARSFDKLPLAIRLGDTVAVTDASGGRIEGKVADLTSSALTLFVDNVRREVPERDIARIARGHRNPGRGAIWGLVAGAAIGAIGISSACSSGDECYGIYYLIVPAVYGGMGAGIGAGLGALTTTYDVVYEKANTSTARVTISPLIAPRRKGVSVSVGF